MSMEYRRLGDSGLDVSAVCLGTMTFGDRTDAAEARRIVDAAFDAGVNFIDTADAYVRGESERIVGAAVKSNRRRWIVATKVANVLTKKPHDGGLSRRWMFQACEDSLARLGTDFIDIYYLHRDDPDTPLAETVGAIGDLVRSGKVRYFGVSNYRGWRIAELVAECEAQGVPRPVVCQPYYNLLNRMPEVEILPACDYYGLGVAPYSPIARGVLTGKYRGGSAPPDSRAGSQGSADDGNRVPRGIAGDRGQARSPCQEDGPHGDAVRARVAVGEPNRLVGDRRAAHACPVAGVRRRRRHAVARRGRDARRFARAARASVDARLQRSAISVLRPHHRVEAAGVAGSNQGSRSPASTANGKRFSGGDSGHDHRSS